MINMIKCGICLAIAKWHIFEVAELSEYVVISQMHILITRTYHRQFRLVTYFRIGATMFNILTAGELCPHFDDY